MMDGVRNFRDAGGYAAATGPVRRGRLFRSGRLAEATAEDETRLRALGIRTIVDLRRGAERDAHPTGRWALSCAVVTSDLGGHADPWAAFLRAGTPSAAAVRDYIRGFYRSMPFEARHVDLFSRYFAALAEQDGPILVHCTGGKDRTGLAITLTHALLGVGRTDMIADYLLTNRHWIADAHLALVAKGMAEEAGRPIEPAAARAAIEVEAAYLDAALAAIAARAGSIAAYLEDVLGITPDRQARIVARLIGHGG